MTDFGQIRQAPGTARGLRVIWMVGLGVAASGVAAFLAWDLGFEGRLNKAHVAEWSVTGPPCPAVSAPWVQSLQLHQRTPLAFEGLNGFMAAGAVNCTENDHVGGRAVPSYPVCQFNAPFVVGVRAGAGPMTYFQPGMGKPVTVSLRDGKVSCVMGARLTDWWTAKTEDAL